MALIDTHTHLEPFRRSGELPAVLQRCREAEVEALITVGTEPDDWKPYRELAAAHPGFVYFSAGLHPCSVEEDWPKAFAELGSYWEAEAGLRPVALGECGLDRFHLPREATEAARVFARQREAFAAQLKLARRLEVPVIVHSRGAFSECVAEIDASGVDWNRVVFHCFAEGPEEMAQLSARGGVGSFTGILTYRSADNVRVAARAQGLERLMLETDAPWLAPEPHRGKRNEPGFVRHIAEFAATRVFSVEFSDLAAATTANARRFFGI